MYGAGPMSAYVDAQTIIGKNLAAAFRLRHAMLVCRAPSLDRCSISEKRKRQDFAGLIQTFEAFDRNEAIDFFENGL
jgi:hypothetical protein